MWVVADLDEDYIAKMEDVLETYEQPYDPQEPVVCLDEKPVTLHADVRPTSAAQPGREARRDNEYERCGTANIFCAVDPKAGRHFTFATPDRSGFEFAQVAMEIEIGIFARQCLGKRPIPNLESLRREARAWNRRMNRDRVKISWKFDRKTARRKFGYKRKSFTRSKT
jgi:hypothetical protein